MIGSKDVSRTMRGLTIVFDLDGTLVDTAPDILAAINHALGHLRVPPVDAEHLRPWVGHGAPLMFQSAIGAAGEKFTQTEHDALLEHFFDYYGSHIAVQSRPFDGAITALESLKAAGAKLAVCTNKMERMSHLLLDALDLRRFFSAVAGRDTLRAAKPHPEHLLGTIRLAGGDASRAVMIGDSSVDVVTAKAANVPVIGVSFGYTDGGGAFTPDAIIDHFRELEPTIGLLLAPTIRVPTARPEAT